MKTEYLGRISNEWKAIFEKCDTLNTQFLVICLEEEDKNILNRWMVEYIQKIILYLKSNFCKDIDAQEVPKRILVVVLGKERTDVLEEAVQEAFWSAVRGIVHTITIEESAKSIRLNAVYAEREQRLQLKDSLDYLSCEQGDFCAGNTYDVRCWK